jgi:hypothetical protein
MDRPLAELRMKWETIPITVIDSHRNCQYMDIAFAPYFTAEVVQWPMTAISMCWGDLLMCFFNLILKCLSMWAYNLSSLQTWWHHWELPILRPSVARGKPRNDARTNTISRLSLPRGSRRGVPSASKSVGRPDIRDVRGRPRKNQITSSMARKSRGRGKKVNFAFAKCVKVDIKSTIVLICRLWQKFGQKMPKWGVQAPTPLSSVLSISPSSKNLLIPHNNWPADRMAIMHSVRSWIDAERR